MPKLIKLSKGEGRRWSTLEQAAWLQEQIPTYLRAKAGGHRGSYLFWEGLYEGWFSRWPAAEAPSATGEDVEAADVIKLASTCRCSVALKLIVQFLQRLKQWYNNHTRGMAAAGSSEHRQKPLNLSVRPTRKLSSTQAYGRLYWPKLKPILDERWDEHIAENPDASGKRGEQLRHRNKALKELLSTETDEVKEEVERRREEGIASDDEAPEPEGADESIGAIEAQRRAKAFAFQK